MSSLSSQAEQQLLAEAKQLGGHKTKRETINEALKEYIRWRKQIEATKLFGTIDFYPDFLAEMERKSQRKHAGLEALAGEG
jgi:hypothetical protein